MGHIRAGRLSLSALELLVVDEADLVLSFGHGADVKALVQGLPRAVQTVLLSATLPEELEAMKRVVLRSPAVLRLEDSAEEGSLTQWVVEVGEEDKYLLLFALVKLKLIAGRAIFFVNDLDGGYRLKLFLDAFSIRSAVLNAELPANSRAHVLQQFHQGVFDFLVATDESMGVDGEESDGEADAAQVLAEEEEEEEEEVMVGENARDDKGKTRIDDEGDDEEASDGEEDDDAEASSDEGDDEEAGDDEDDDDDDDDDDDEEAGARPGKRRRAARSGAAGGGEEAPSKLEEQAPELRAAARRRRRRQQRLQRLRADLEYGVARGVDFRGVGTIVNVDFPPTLHAYVHRIGRTARGGASGAALTFIRPKDLSAEAIVARARASQTPAPDGSPQPATLPFDKSEVTGFRYRVRQVLAGLRNRKVVREARAAELRQEMLNSERLRAHFEDNPDDLRVLRHDGPLLPSRVRPELASLPSYLLPGSIRAAAEAAAASSTKSNAAAAAAAAATETAAPGSRPKAGRRGGSKGGEDPLKAFSKHAARMGVGSGEQATFKVGPGAHTVGGGGGGAGASKSGRTMWKMRHKKGKFSHKNQKKQSRPF